MALCTAYEQCPRYAHHKNAVAECLLCTITGNARAMTSDSQAPVQFREKAINTAVYLHRRLPNHGLKTNHRDVYQVPFEKRSELLYGSREPMHHDDGNMILYQSSLHNLPQVGCFGRTLFSIVQC